MDDMNLAELLDRAAVSHARRVAIRLDDEALTYRDLAAATVSAAARLAAAGVGPGDRVGLVLPHVPAFAVWYYAALRRGAVVVALDPALAPRHLVRYLDDADGAAVVACSEVARPEGSDATWLDTDTDAPAADPGPAPVVARAADDVAAIVYTSGTTGTPKGAVLTHGNLLGNARHVGEDLYELAEDDVLLGVLPFFGAFGQTCVLNAAVLAGAQVTLAPRADAARAREVIARDRVSVIAAVPSMYVSLVRDAGPDATSVRLCLSGGAALPLDVLLRVERTFGCVVLEGYGLSEASPVVAFNRIDRRLIGSVGQPMPGVEVRVVGPEGREAGVGETGEILVRGHNVMAGYWRRPEGSRLALDGGWLHTGDLGRRDADGFVHLVDRAGEVLVRAGEPVYPREIEEVLYDHPAVAEAAVVEVAEGAELVAFVTLRPGAPSDPAPLVRHLQQLPAHARPTHVEVVADLPKTSTGKILKRSLRMAVHS